MNEKKKIFNKTSMLMEIETFLQTSANWNSLEVITAIFETLSINLFRSMPDSYHIDHIMGVDHYIPITYSLPCWQHFSIIYQILTLTLSTNELPRQLITEYIKKYELIPHLIHLLNSLDKRERQRIQSIIELIYELLLDDDNDSTSHLIIEHLSNYCFDFIHADIGNAEGIKSVLNIFNSLSLISSNIFCTILIPLHSMQYADFRIYEFVLWIYCKRIIDDDEYLALLLLRQLIKHWPIRNAFKEQQFIKKIGLILEFLDEDIWQKSA